MTYDQQHPITPPPELVQQWIDQSSHAIHRYRSIATLAAQWGADQELEACCDCIFSAHSDPAVTGDTALVDKRVLVSQLRATRRPKPPSLKEQALMALEDGDTGPGALLTATEVCIIRRALEALPDDL